MRGFLEKILKDAGGVVTPFFGTQCVEYTKAGGSMDVVTQADLAANDLLVDAIRSTYPDHGIISEESGVHQSDAEYVWTIDPLDGTANFTRGLPIFMVMVSLLQHQEPVLAGVYHPITQDLAIAQAGRGSVLNGRTIHCSDKKSIEESFGGTTSTISERVITFYQQLIKEKTTVKVGTFGCAAYTGLAVASGMRDWLVTFNTNVWDMAPIALLMKEAGCLITNSQGESWKPGDDIVAANAFIHPELMHILEYHHRKQ